MFGAFGRVWLDPTLEIDWNLDVVVSTSILRGTSTSTSTSSTSDLFYLPVDDRRDMVVIIIDERWQTPQTRQSLE